MQKKTNEALIGNLEVARSLWTRMKGLLGRRSLPLHGGLWIEPCSSIHTWFMRFTIDAVFLDPQGRVIKIVSHLRPWQIAFAPGAHAVVELADGSAERLHIRQGDILQCRDS